MDYEHWAFKALGVVRGGSAELLRTGPRWTLAFRPDDGGERERPLRQPREEENQERVRSFLSF